MRRFGARATFRARVTFGTTRRERHGGGHNTEPFITRLRALSRVAYTRRGTMLESVTCPLRVFLLDCTARREAGLQ